MIRFFNTFTAELDEFKPIRQGEAGVYTCGPTVYDFAHIGNFRAFVFEDLLRRFLEASDFRVKHVMNLTDVDDKTIAGAQREKKSLNDYTAFYIQAFLEDLNTLHILPPTVQPRATLEIPEMIRHIEGLIGKGCAYESEGSVYFRVSTFPLYGVLSKKKLDKNIEGARVDVDEYEKEQGADFVLWKSAKGGEPSWDSPWGKGRPGWHIECSVMSMKHLGETFDIHAGGEDLIFPHHENEIAQSEALTGKKFVHYWLHCKFLLVNGEKMSKSKGNFYTLRDLLKRGEDPMAIRMLLLSTHYRKPLNFTFEGLREAGELIKKLDHCYHQVTDRLSRPEAEALLDSGTGLKLDALERKMLDWLSEDLNISGCLASLLEAATLLNGALLKMSRTELEKAVSFFGRVDHLLGLDIAETAVIPRELLDKVQERNRIRAGADFKTNRDLQKRSDDLRREIQEAGGILKDGKPGDPSLIKMKRRVWE